MITNEQVWLYGTEDEQWPVDINPRTGETELNGAVQWRMFLDGDPYLVITSWDETVLYRPDDPAMLEPGYVRRD